HDKIKTIILDKLLAETAANKATIHPDYATLAARVEVSNLHKETNKLFSRVIHNLYWHEHPTTRQHMPLVSDEICGIVMKNASKLDAAIIHERDFGYGYFGIKTLEQSYLLRIDNVIVERPQYMLMRVAVGIHGVGIDAAIETYNLLSQRYYTHASPTLFN